MTLNMKQTAQLRSQAGPALPVTVESKLVFHFAHTEDKDNYRPQRTVVERGDSGGAGDGMEVDSLPSMH